MAQTLSARLISLLRQLLSVFLKAGLKPFQVLLHALYKRLSTLYSMLMKLARRRGDKPDRPGGELEKKAEMVARSLEVIKVQDGEVISIDGVQGSSFPYGRNIHARSVENIRAARDAHDMAVTFSRNQSRASFVPSLNSAAEEEEYIINVQQQSPTTPDRQFSLGQAIEVQTPSNSSRSESPSPRVDRPESRLRPSLRPKRERSPLGYDRDTGHAHFDVALDPPPSVFDRYDRRASSRRGHSPASSRQSAGGASVHTDYNVGPLPRVGTHVDDVIIVAPSTSRPTTPSTKSARSARPIPPLNVPHIYALAPSWHSRYESRVIISDESHPLKLEPVTRHFLDHANPEGWQYVVHPEGTPYFYSPSKRVLTDANLFAPGLLKRVNDDAELIQSHIRTHRVPMPEHYDIVLDLGYSGDEVLTDYYCADHDNRVIFYLDAFDPQYLPVWQEIKGIYSVQHVGIELQAQYWYHLQFYPTTVQLDQQMVGELRDTVLNFIGDTMTSPTSTSPYTEEDLYKILSLTNALKKNADRISPGSVNLIGRFMYIFCRQKFYNFYGLPCARLERNVSVYGHQTNRRTWLIKALSPFLWSAPDVHLFGIQRLWGDGILHKCVYEQVVKKMNDEWQEYVLFATVLLNANVAFLAIQSVDEGGGTEPDQIASYISAIMSVGSVILGLLLVRQNRTKNRETAEDMQTFLRNRTHPVLGLETLAILFSLPYAFLMWGMVFFLLAFAFMVFDGTGAVTSTLVGVTGAVVCSLIVWSIVTNWEKRPGVPDRTPPPYLPAGEDYDDEKLKAQVFGPSPKPKSSSSDADAKSNSEKKTWYSPLTKGIQWTIPIRRSSTSTEKTVVDDV